MRLPRIYEEDGCCTAAECDLCGGDDTLERARLRRAPRRG